MGDQLRPHCSLPLFSSLRATSFALAQQAVVRDLWLWRTPVVRRSLPEHTPIDLTHAPLDFPLSGAQLHLSAGPHLPTPHAAAARGHTPNQHRSCDCSSPALTANVGIESATSTTPVVVPFLRLDWYPLTITSSLALAVPCQPANEAKAAPLCSCVPRCSKSTGHNDGHRLDPRVKIARALLRILKRVLSR